MLTVYKYEIPAQLTGMGAIFERGFELILPKGANPLKMGVQETRSSWFQLWALVDPHEQVVQKRRFLFLGTGHTYKPGENELLLFVDSWVSDGLVFHLFEVVAREAAIPM